MLQLHLLILSDNLTISKHLAFTTDQPDFVAAQIDPANPHLSARCRRDVDACQLHLAAHIEGQREESKREAEKGRDCQRESARVSARVGARRECQMPEERTCTSDSECTRVCDCECVKIYAQQRVLPTVQSRKKSSVSGCEESPSS